jgi:hypothetical protein
MMTPTNNTQNAESSIAQQPLGAPSKVEQTLSSLSSISLSGDVKFTITELQSLLIQVKETASTVDNLLTDAKLEKINTLIDKVASITETLGVQGENPLKVIETMVIDVIMSLVGKAQVALIEASKEIAIVVLFLGLAISAYKNPDPLIVSVTMGLGTFIGLKYAGKIELDLISNIMSFFGVRPQMDYGDVENFSTLITTLATTYVTFTSGVNVPKTLLKNMCDFAKIRDSLNEILTLVITLFEKCYNYVKVKLLGLDKGSSFLVTNIEQIDRFEQSVNDIFNLENSKEFFRNQENFDTLILLISEAKFLLKTMPPQRKYFNVVKSINTNLSYLLKIQQLFLDSNFSNSGFRQEPVAVMLKGGPGCGKSGSMMAMGQALCARYLPERKLKELARDPNAFTFNRQFETQYWEGYTPSKFVTYFDDLGQTRDVAGNPDNEFSNLIRAINSFAYKLHMPDLASKGNTDFVSMFVLATTNMIQLRSESIYSLEALERRFGRTYVVIPKPEYTTPESLNSDYFNRKFLKSRLNPGEAISPEHLHYIPELNGQYSTPLLFNEVMEEIFSDYEQKKSWYLDYVEKMRIIRESYALENEEIKLNVVPQMDNFHDALEPEVVQFQEDPQAVLVGEEHAARTFQRTPGPHDDRLPPFETLFGFGHDVDFGTWNEERDTFNAHLAESDPAIRNMAINILANKFGQIDNLEVRYRLYLTYQHEVMRAFRYSADQPSFFMAVIITTGIVPIDLSQDPLLNYVKHSSFLNLPMWAYNSLRELKADIKILSEANPQVMLTTRIAVGLRWLSKAVFFYMCYRTVKMIANVIGSFFPGIYAIPNSFGSSDKLRSYRDPKLLKQRINNVIPQMDSSGIDLVTSICNTNSYEFHTESNHGTNEWKKSGFATFIKGRYFLIPYHFITTCFARVEEDPDIRYARCRLLRRSNKEKNFCYDLTVEEILKNFQCGKLVENDLAIVLAPKRVQPHTDRLQHFALRADWQHAVQTTPFRLVFPNCVGKEAIVGYLARNNDLAVREVTTDVKGKDVIGKVSYFVKHTFEYMGVVGVGDCGALLTLLNPKMATRKIIGFHVAGSAQCQRGYAGAVCQEDLIHDLALFEKPDSTVDDDLTQKLGQPEHVYGQGQFWPLGTIKPAPSAPSVTTITPSNLYGAWGQPSTAPAYLRPLQVENQVIDPILNGLNEYSSNLVLPDLKVLSLAAAELFHDLNQHSPHYVVPRTFSYVEAVQGLDYDADFGPIDRNTSAGWPFNVGVESGNLPRKQRFWGNGPEFDFGRSESRELETQIYADIREHLAGKRITEFYTSFPKDERRSLEKLSKYNTRLVDAGTTKYLVKVRMYFGAFVLWFFKNRIYNGSAVGVNPYSSEWNVMTENFLHMNEDDLLVGAGDFKGLDKNEVPAVLYEILDIINRWYNDPEGNKVREILFLEICFSRHIFRGEVLQMSSSIPSGNPITTLINTMYVMVAMRYCFIKLTGDFEFSLCVYLIVLGDDHVFSVVKEYREMFNEMTLGPAMAEFGLIYTNDQKVTSTQPFRPITQVEFLKRGFRFCEVLNRWVAPHRLEAILEVPYWTRKNAQREAITVSNFEFLLRELTLHGKELYDKLMPFLTAKFYERVPGTRLTIAVSNWENLYRQVSETEGFFF